MASPIALGDDDARQITHELAPGEELLWSGQPRGGIRLRAADAFAIPFSLMWGGFAIFWEAMVIRSNAGPFFILWGVPFVLIGLYMIFGRFLVEARTRASTFYGLSDQRVIIISGVVRRSVRSLDLATLPQLSMTESPDGTGTITFGPEYAMMSWFRGAGWPGASSRLAPAFDLIPDARRVYEQIRQVQYQSRQAATRPGDQ